jgi:hypothetical protein
MFSNTISDPSAMVIKLRYANPTSFTMIGPPGLFSHTLETNFFGIDGLKQVVIGLRLGLRVWNE